MGFASFFFIEESSSSTKWESKVELCKLAMVLVIGWLSDIRWPGLVRGDGTFVGRDS